jgi:hypothetical protein
MVDVLRKLVADGFADLVVVFPRQPFAAARRSGTVSRSQTITFAFMRAKCCTIDGAS